MGEDRWTENLECLFVADPDEKNKKQNKKCMLYGHKQRSAASYMDMRRKLRNGFYFFRRLEWGTKKNSRPWVPLLQVRGLRAQATAL